MKTHRVRRNLQLLVVLSAGLAACEDGLPTTLPVIHELKAAKTTVRPGATTTLSWKVTNANNIKIVATPGDVTVIDTAMAEGMVETPAIAVETKFTLTATNDNASISLSVTVKVGEETVDGPPRILSFTVDRDQIDPGESVTLAWEVEDATSIVILNSSDVAVHTTTALTGTVAVTPARTTAYTLVARGRDFDAKENVFVTVTGTGGARVLSFSTNTQAVGLGGVATLSWEVAEATAVRIDANGRLIHESDRATGTFDVQPAVTTTYTLTALNANGNASARVTVAVNPSAPAILSFSADPNPAGRRGRTRLSWSTLGADELVVRQDANVLLEVEAADDPGHLDVTITSSVVRFELAATNASGTTTRTVTVTTGALPEIVSFTVDVATFTGATMVLVEWETRGADSVELFTNGAAAAGFPGTPVGTQTINVTDTTSFELVARNGFGSVSILRAVVEVATESEPNDSISRANALAGTANAINGSAGGNDTDYFAIDVPAGGFVDARLVDVCTGTSVLRLYDRDGVTLRGSSIGGAGCPAIDPSVQAFARNLAGGRYYVSIGGSMFPAAYTLRIVVGSPSCGNDVPELGEECDDGNVAGGDGCTNFCTFEPNGTTSGPPSEVTFPGALLEPGEADVYRVDMTAAGGIFARTYTPNAPNCTTAGPSNPPTNDTVLELRDASFALLGENDQSFNPPSNCSEIDPTRHPFAIVSAGTYYVVVRHFAPTGTTPAYEVVIRTVGVACGNGILESGETCDDGNTTAGDGCSDTCTFEGVVEQEPNDVPTDSGVVTLSGLAGAFAGSTSGGDVDLWRIEVPANHSVWARVMVNNQCFGGGPSEPHLQLRNADGLPIAFTGPPDPLSGCTTLDPRMDRAVAGLAAGTYYVAVVAPPFLNVPQYELYVEVIPPACGNLIPEAPEQCEDGNTVSGDGCNSACQLEIAGVLLPPGGTVTASVPPSFGAFIVVQVELTTPGQSISATVRNQTGGCSPDFELLFVNTVAQQSFGIQPGFCDILYPFDRFAVGLPVGTYWIIALPNQRMPAGGDFTFTVTVHDPACGDAVLQSAANEQCDDGNMVDGDGCTVDCQIEFLGEVALPAGSPAVFADAIVPADQVDFYEITVTSSTALYLAIETFVPNVAGGCMGMGPPGMSSNDTVIRLFDATGVMIAENDQAKPAVNCSRLRGVRVTQGTYVLQVSSYQALGQIPAYEVRIESSPADICGNGLIEPGETCDDNNTTSGDGCSASCEYEGVLVVETEPNGTQATADALGLTGVGTVHAQGGNNPSGDNDVFSFVVPANAVLTIRALTHTDPINPTICNNAMSDTTLYVEAAGIEVSGWGPDQGQLAWNDDAGPGFFCSEIDFALPVSSTAQTYYLRVQGFQNSNITEYYLDVTLQ